MEKISFKKRSVKNKPVRTKLSDDDDEQSNVDEDVISKLQETREKQRLREKPNGISLAGLVVGKKVTAEEELTSKDVFNIKSGGMLNMQALKAGKIKTTAEDPYDTSIGTQFSAETNKRDEDEEMMKYIEDKLKNQKGETDKDNEEDGKYFSPEESALFALPEHLRISTTHRSEEMLSNQMLSGIPEVDLGIEAKIKNIEATEEAKQKLIIEQRNRRDHGPSHFVPANVAVNFIQHNRFNIDDHRKRKREENQKKFNNNANNNKPQGPKKATDDYHYDKFRKQFRKH